VVGIPVFGYVLEDVSVLVQKRECGLNNTLCDNKRAGRLGDRRGDRHGDERMVTALGVVSGLCYSCFSSTALVEEKHQTGAMLSPASVHPAPSAGHAGRCNTSQHQSGLKW